MSKSSRQDEGYFKSHDHHRLYYRISDVPSSRAVLVFVHGLNEHSGRYGNTVSYFTGQGYTCTLFDHRGHGKSDGLRSFVDNFDHYTDDLAEFVSFVSGSLPGKKIFVIGHSMGGQIVINYVGRKKPGIAGFITSSANIRLALPVSCLKRGLGEIGRIVAPRFALTNEIDPALISRDKAVVSTYKSDPLVSKKITLKLASELLHNQQKLIAMAPKICFPALIMHAGADRICHPDGSREFYERLGAKDKELKIYDGFFHEIMNEIGKERVFDDMAAWLSKHV